MSEQKATVGRVVHFYNESIGGGENNSMGPGPYAAIVAQTFASGPYVNLKVLVPFGEDRYEGSVSEGVAGSGRYWTWPPRS